MSEPSVLSATRSDRRPCSPIQPVSSPSQNRSEILPTTQAPLEDAGVPTTLRMRNTCDVGSRDLGDPAEERETRPVHRNSWSSDAPSATLEGPLEHTRLQRRAPVHSTETNRFQRPGTSHLQATRRSR